MVQKLRCFTIIIMIANDLSFFHVGLSISDAPLGRTMLIRWGQLVREENLKRSGAIFEVILLWWWPEPQTLVIIAS